MDRATTELLHDVIPVVRVLLTETTGLRGADQLLADRIESLTTELAEGGLHELASSGQAVRALDV